MSAAKTSKQNAEEIIAGFNKLRMEQRQTAQKVAELEQELNEHRLVIESLECVDKSRKCFRLIGGVLVERTVNEVLPALRSNSEQLTQVVSMLKEQVMKKSQTITDYREKYQIRVQGQGNPAEDKKAAAAAAAGAATGVLVAQGQT